MAGGPEGAGMRPEAWRYTFLIMRMIVNWVMGLLGHMDALVACRAGLVGVAAAGYCGGSDEQARKRGRSGPCRSGSRALIDERWDGHP